MGAVNWSEFLGKVYLLWLTLLWSFWWGGLSFYAMVVVPIGTDILGSVGQGFITQRVTHVHNAVSGLMILFVFVESFRRKSKVLSFAGVVLLLALIAEVFWHRRLTGLVDFKDRSVPSGFYAEHAIYLWMTAVEWGLGIMIPMFLLIPTTQKTSIVVEPPRN